jgi:hypothetical protein
MGIPVREGGIGTAQSRLVVDGPLPICPMPAESRIELGSPVDPQESA